jgi:hypothetical protein
LTQVAGLDPTLRSVADLRGPMTNVAGLGLVGLPPSLDAAAGLSGKSLRSTDVTSSLSG